jgi:hypothetical protein
MGFFNSALRNTRKTHRNFYKLSNLSDSDAVQATSQGNNESGHVQDFQVIEGEFCLKVS